MSSEIEFPLLKFSQAQFSLLSFSGTLSSIHMGSSLGEDDEDEDDDDEDDEDEDGHS